jgi:uncharacterized tellurite resistance protein B-like protein
MLDQLTIEEKVRLIRFMCSFAWADLDVSDRERTMIRDLVRKLGLPEPAASEAESWLDHPPDEEELDPYDIPLEQRRLFVSAAAQMVSADGVVDVMEVENFALFEALLGGGEQAFGDEE